MVVSSSVDSAGLVLEPLGESAAAAASIAAYARAGDQMLRLCDLTWKIGIGLVVLCMVAWLVGVLPAAVRLI
jgi:hypothetical protein